MSSKKRSVLVVTSLFPSPVTASFAGSFVVAQLIALSNYFQPIVLVPYRLPMRQMFRQPYLEKKAVAGLDVYYWAYFPWRAFLSYLIGKLFRRAEENRYVFLRLQKEDLAYQLLDQSRRLNDQHQFALVHGQEVYIGDEAVPIAKSLGLPSAVTLHSLADFHQHAYGQPAMELVLANLRQATALVTVSKIAARSYRALKKEISVIPNGFTRLPTKALPASLKRKIGSRTIILYAGFFIPSKKADLLLQAVAKLSRELGNQFVLLMIGVGPQAAELKAYVAQNNLDRQVIFLGEVTPAQIPSYYAAADFLVQPSISESFSMVCLEAMAYGKPFIATNTTGMVEHVTAGREALIVAPDNLAQLTAAIGLLLGDPKRRLAMGRAALVASRKLDWQSVIKQTVTLYQTILNEKKR